MLETQVLSDIEKRIVCSLFKVKDGSIEFTGNIADKTGPDFVHSPLQQLFEFYHRWGGILPPKIDDLQQQWLRKDPQENTEDGVVVLPELIGSPCDLFYSLEHNGLSQDFWNFVEKAEMVLLLGVICLPSLYDMMSWLNSKNFCGVLQVYDISEVPLNVARVYKQFGLLPNAPKLKLVQKSVLNIADYNSAEIILSDVLGYYLPPEDYRKLIGQVCSTLTPGGIWLTRELIEPNGQLPPNQRTVRMNYSQRLDNFNDFIEALLGTRIKSDDLAEWEATRWLKVPTYARKNRSEYFGNVKDLTEKAAIRSSSKPLWNTSSKRVFETVVFKK